MSKNFVREINNINDITKQSYLTNKVNDLLSTKKHNYIRKETQEYHCLTDNIKTLASSNTSLLAVTNYNDTTNKAMLHPKHDTTKEQLLKSTNDTIMITHAPNNTEEKTNVVTNPQKVLEHDNLIAGTNLTKTHNDGTNTTTLKVSDEFTNLVNQKQNKLSAGDGISITGDRISLKTQDNYNGDLNDLTYTCLIKPADNAPHLPEGVPGNGILTVVRIGNVVSQQYHPFMGTSLYIRAGRDLSTEAKWSDWTRLAGQPVSEGISTIPL